MNSYVGRKVQNLKAFTILPIPRSDAFIPLPEN